jgi:RNA recognition motif-containing protein
VRKNMKSKKLYVGNLSQYVTYEKLEELFSEYGEVEEITKREDCDFGFVEMSTRSDAERAKRGLNGLHFNGRVLIVDEARPPKKAKIRLPTGKRRAGSRRDFHKTDYQKGGVIGMKRFNDIIHSSAAGYQEDLDTDDLAMIESVVGILEEDVERNRQRKFIKWELDELIDEF